MSLEERTIGEKEARSMIVASGETSGSLQQTVQGEISSQVMTARKYPRSLARFKSKLTEMVRLNKQVAESSYYLVPRAGKRLFGPSIRMAEMACSCYQNCRIAARIVEIGATDVTVEGVAFDMENNVAWYVQTKRRITDRNGKRYNDDLITLTVNAAISIAARNAALRMIPRSLIDETLTIAKQTVAGEIKNIVEARAGVMKKCKELGLSDARVFAFLNIEGADDMTVSHIVDLSGALNAIQDGEATIPDTFPEPTGNGMDKPGRRTFGRKKVAPPAPKSPAFGVVSAPDPNRPAKMSNVTGMVFWKKAEEISGTRSKAIVAVQLAIDTLVKEQTISAIIQGWQDLSDNDAKFVLAALERLEKKE